MVSSVAGPRVLLRRLREVMAEPESAQKRLEKISVAIAANMVAEVCSVYLVRPDNILELFATEGLNPDAVHNTFLNTGEGLVGLIAAEAETLSLSDAHAHPAFAYRPETGEDAFSSFLGVPILRLGRTLGVLVVQNRTQRTYNEEEVEVLQTTAMVLAEMIVAENMAATVVADEPKLGLMSSVQLKATSFARGIALGCAVFHEPRVNVVKLIADNPAAEQRRLDVAITALRFAVEEMLREPDVVRGGDHRDILEVYRMYAYDRGWVRKIEEAISTGLTAEAAVERVQNETLARLLRQPDPYLRDRLHDFDDLTNRLLRILAGRSATASAEDLPEDAIIFARNMGPADLLDYDRERLRALVLEEGGATSHVAIVARALGIPMVGRVDNILQLVDAGDPIIVDGDTGELYVRPSGEIEASYTEKLKFIELRKAQYAKLRDRQAVSVDGHRIKLYMNAGLPVDIDHLDESGADGIGLFRTEFQFMIASKFPRLDEQTAVYRSVIEAAKGQRVVFRSLDIGGDKVIPYMRQAEEENPALGWRAIRMSLDRPALLRSQIRALLRASGEGQLNLMFPMVSEADEVIRARALVDKEIEFLTRHNYKIPSTINIGVMLEVPSLIWHIPALTPYVDFISVGSNDLLQFMFASDRSSPRLTGRFDALSPAFLKILRQIVLECRAHDIPLSLCGEMAGVPVEAMALIAIGFRSISMSASSIGPVKEMVLKLDASALEAELLPKLDEPVKSLRSTIEAFALNNGISL
jgi:phosphotransferase system, enzyme I, PtsP